MNRAQPKRTDLGALQNAFLQLSIHPQAGSWSLRSFEYPEASVDRVEMGVFYRTRWSQHTLSPQRNVQVSHLQNTPSPHGELHQVQLTAGPDSQGVRYVVTLALPENLPLLLWKMRVDNLGKAPVWIDRLEMLNVGFVFVSQFSGRALSLHSQDSLHSGMGSIHFCKEDGQLGFFSNGWQSWSYSGAYREGDRYRRTRFGPLHAPSIANAYTPQPGRKGLFASDMFGVLGDRTHRIAFLAGFLSQKQNFGSLEALTSSFTPALRMWANGDGARLDPGAQFCTDWACAGFFHLDAPDPLGSYLEAVARENDQKPAKQETFAERIDIPVGWCSWYQYFQAVTPQNILENLQSASALRSDLPMRLILIDDGFENQVGDWLSFSNRFPSGVAPQAEAIRQAGFLPGLWLAPFIVHPRSQLMRQHPDWLLRNRWGLPANAGLQWNTFCTGLDLTVPEALDYVQTVIRTAIREWGFPFLKLDFLYAAALPGRYHDPTQTRAQVLRKGLQAIREAAGDGAHLLGCGCPLGPAIGLVDSMRIGADVDRQWEPVYLNIKRPFRQEAAFPSVRNAIHNTLTRAPLHHRWWINDPDCLLLRPNTHLTLAEVQTQATVIALTGGTLLVSDHLAGLPPERLRILASLLPLIGKRPYLLDWFDQQTPARVQLDLEGPIGRWHLLALFNWEDHPTDLPLHPEDFYLDPKASYWLRSFWDERLFSLGSSGVSRGRNSSEGLVFSSVPPHGVVLLAAHPARSHQPLYLGSDLHVSQGLEVSTWRRGTDELEFCLERPGNIQGKLDLYLPRPPRFAKLAGEAIPWEEKGNGIVSFLISFRKTANLKIQY